MRPYRLRWVDVFTERPLAGNPLAVVLHADGLSTRTMQAVARETNLSETTFVLPAKNPGHAARVRIFTPSAELPFAGHPTIGTAWVLMDEGLVGDRTDSFTLEEEVGPVPLRVERTPDGIRLWMTHPPVTFGDVIERRAEMAAALELTLDDLLPDVPLQVASTGLSFLYVAVRNPRAVDAAVSSGERLAKMLETNGLPAVFLFACIDPHRLYSRMFGPHAIMSIVEDPATGSASGPLGAFAVRYGLVPRVTDVTLVSEQGTKMGRQSFVHIKLAYPPQGDLPSRIEVGGSAVPVMAAELSVAE